jgi:hypothetical protein
VHALRHDAFNPELAGMVEHYGPIRFISAEAAMFVKAAVQATIMAIRIVMWSSVGNQGYCKSYAGLRAAPTHKTFEYARFALRRI